MYDKKGSLKLLFSSHVRERDEALLSATLAGRFGMVLSYAN